MLIHSKVVTQTNGRNMSVGLFFEANNDDSKECGAPKTKCFDTWQNWSVLGVMWCIIQGGLFTLWTHGFDYFNTCNCFYLWELCSSLSIWNHFTALNALFKGVQSLLHSSHHKVSDSTLVFVSTFLQISNYCSLLAIELLTSLTSASPEFSADSALPSLAYFASQRLLF